MIQDYINIKDHINLSVLKVDDIVIAITSNRIGYISNWGLWNDAEIEL